MSGELLSGNEPAGQYELHDVLVGMKTWLLERGHRTGGENIRRMADGTAIYDVTDDVSFNDDIESYEIVANQEILSFLDPTIIARLQVGNEIRFSYTPGHYLVSRESGRFEPYPESFQALVTSPDDSKLSEISYSVTRGDFDTDILVGYRHRVIKRDYARSAGSGTEIFSGQNGNSFENVYQKVMANLDVPSKRECAAMLDIVSALKQLK